MNKTQFMKKYMDWNIYLKFKSIKKIEIKTLSQQIL
jgi:hypothetical protein